MNILSGIISLNLENFRFRDTFSNWEWFIQDLKNANTHRALDYLTFFAWAYKDRSPQSILDSQHESTLSSDDDDLFTYIETCLENPGKYKGLINTLSDRTIRKSKDSTKKFNSSDLVRDFLCKMINLTELALKKAIDDLTEEEKQEAIVDYDLKLNEPDEDITNLLKFLIGACTIELKNDKGEEKPLEILAGSDLAKILESLDIDIEKYYPSICELVPGSRAIEENGGKVLSNNVTFSLTLDEIFTKYKSLDEESDQAKSLEIKYNCLAKTVFLHERFDQLIAESSIEKLVNCSPKILAEEYQKIAKQTDKDYGRIEELLDQVRYSCSLKVRNQLSDARAFDDSKKKRYFGVRR